MVRLAKGDSTPLVRLRVAGALQRVPLESRWPILTTLAANAQDAGDQNLPLMIWYAAEPAVAADAAQATNLLADCKIPKLTEFIARRMASK